MRASVLVAILVALAYPVHAEGELQRIDVQLTRCNDLRSDANRQHACGYILAAAFYTGDFLPFFRECTKAGRAAEEEG